MASYQYHSDRQPLIWWKGYPLYLSAILGLFVLVSMVGTSVIMAMDQGEGSLLHKLKFTYSNLWESGYIWTLFTYLGLNTPSISTLFSAFILWRLGTELETYLGRSVFVRFLVFLAIISPLTLSVIGLLTPTGKELSSLYLVSWGVLAGFATLHPNARFSILIATVPAWGLAAFFFVFNLLRLLPQRDWAEILLFITSTLAALAFISFQQGRWTFQLPKAPLPTAPTPRRSQMSGKGVPAPKNQSFQGTVDDLLDKISQKGMHSLSKEERDFLHRESKKLADKKN